MMTTRELFARCKLLNSFPMILESNKNSIIVADDTLECEIINPNECTQTTRVYCNVLKVIESSTKQDGVGICSDVVFWSDVSGMKNSTMVTHSSNGVLEAFIIVNKCKGILELNDFIYIMVLDNNNKDTWLYVMSRSLETVKRVQLEDDTVIPKYKYDNKGRLVQDGSTDFTGKFNSIS